MVRLSVDQLCEVTLWDLERPKLYDVVTTLVWNGQALHQHRARTGFRQARFELNGFFLNGRRVKLFGANRHQHYPYTGFAMGDRAQRRDAEILRLELNCNMVRCSHYPQAPAFLDACDELGLLVWEEPAGWQYLGDQAWKELACRDVEEMVRRDRNRPCIVIWAPRLNETADDTELYTRTEQIVKALDGSRQTAGATHGAVLPDPELPARRLRLRRLHHLHRRQGPLPLLAATPHRPSLPHQRVDHLALEPYPALPADRHPRGAGAPGAGPRHSPQQGRR